jgi:hypothetical protein
MPRFVKINRSNNIEEQITLPRAARRPGAGQRRTSLTCTTGTIGYKFKVARYTSAAFKLAGAPSSKLQA